MALIRHLKIFQHTLTFQGALNGPPSPGLLICYQWSHLRASFMETTPARHLQVKDSNFSDFQDFRFHDTIGANDNWYISISWGGWGLTDSSTTFDGSKLVQVAGNGHCMPRNCWIAMDRNGLIQLERNLIWTKQNYSSSNLYVCWSNDWWLPGCKDYSSYEKYTFNKGCCFNGMEVCGKFKLAIAIDETRGA